MILDNEDRALKKFLQGLVVGDDTQSPRPVSVYFGMPDSELRKRGYPHMTIDLVDISQDTQRAQRGFGPLGYNPEGWTPNISLSEPEMEIPIPIIIQYQITAYSRFPQHDRMIMAQMLQRFPYQMGGIEVPEDNTVRRAYLVGFRQQDTVDENQKRLYRKTWTVNVESEILPLQIKQFLQVQSVNVDIAETTLFTSVQIP